MESETDYYLTRYVATRNEHGTLSHYVEELRDIIRQAALHDRLSGVQRDELLALVEAIDRERQSLEGGV
ncbi:MAG: hypothetical protein QM808_13355 [Steroidobacteraceae bacterium]